MCGSQLKRTWSSWWGRRGGRRWGSGHVMSAPGSRRAEPLVVSALSPCVQSGTPGHVPAPFRVVFFLGWTCLKIPSKTSPKVCFLSDSKIQPSWQWIWNISGPRGCLFLCMVWCCWDIGRVPVACLYVNSQNEAWLKEYKTDTDVSKNTLEKHSIQHSGRWGVLNKFHDQQSENP